MEKILKEVQDFVQSCIDGQNKSNVTIISNEEIIYANENDNVNERVSDIKELDYTYCQDCGKKIWYNKDTMFIPQYCSYCEEH